MPDHTQMENIHERIKNVWLFNSTENMSIVGIRWFFDVDSARKFVGYKNYLTELISFGALYVVPVVNEKIEDNFTGTYTEIRIGENIPSNVLNQELHMEAIRHIKLLEHLLADALREKNR